MVLDSALSAASTLFAAVAAGAVRTIQMTREAAREQALRRLLNALAAFQHAAYALIAPRTEQDRLISVELFLDAQRKLEMALAEPVAVYTLTDIETAQAHIDYLRRALPDIRPAEIHAKAIDASLLLRSKLVPRVGNAPAERCTRSPRLRNDGWCPVYRDVTVAARSTEPRAVRDYTKSQARRLAAD